MAKAILPIPPFPADTDRRDFSNYVTGFTDGEGCFQLRLHEKTRHGLRWRTPELSFSIGLRADDLPILRLIQSFFGCGAIGLMKRRSEVDWHPQYRFQVCAVNDLALVIVPHFDAFPLRAKKARDFTVWRQGVLLAHRVNLLPAGRAGKQGRVVKWTAERVADFRMLANSLKTGRAFDAHDIPLPTHPSDEPSLFD